MLHLRQFKHLRVAIFVLTVATLCVASASTQSDLLPPIPQLCDSIQCPADEDMQCPEDSSVREIREINAVNLLTSNAVEGTSGSSSASSSPSNNSGSGSSTSNNNSSNNNNKNSLTAEWSAYNSSQMDDELFAQCCLSKKCVCNTCYIPDCSSETGEVVVELVPEAMETPGHCCGTYECQLEPNCSEVMNTDYYWLKSCKRCKCYLGAAICHQSCDEGTNAICESKKLMKFFKDGENWEDGCLQCECVKGEAKCVIPFCGHVNCPSERQIMLKDSCCPVCWPKGEPMPHEKPINYDDGYGYDHDEQPQPEHTNDKEEKSSEADTGHEADTETELPVLPPEEPSPTTTTTTTTTTTSTTSLPKGTQDAELIEYPVGSRSTVAATATAAAAAPPCQVHDFPKVVEVVHEKGFLNNIYQAVIVVLTVIIFGMYLYIRRLQAKQRSYRPVSNFDDKV